MAIILALSTACVRGLPSARVSPRCDEGCEPTRVLVACREGFHGKLVSPHRSVPAPRFGLTRDHRASPAGQASARLGATSCDRATCAGVRLKPNLRAVCRDLGGSFSTDSRDAVRWYRLAGVSELTPAAHLAPPGGRFTSRANSSFGDPPLFFKRQARLVAEAQEREIGSKPLATLARRSTRTMTDDQLTPLFSSPVLIPGLTRPPHAKMRLWGLEHRCIVIARKELAARGKENLKSQISNLKFQISDFRFQIS